MKKSVIYLLYCLLSLTASGQQMKVGIFTDIITKKVNFAYNEGSYSVFGDSIDFGAILQDEFVEIKFLAENQIELKIGVDKKGVFKSIRLIETKFNSSLAVTPTEPITKQRKYRNDIEVKTSTKGLVIINNVDMNNYVSGVVESEGGAGKHPEYYKVQALMSRTYALKYKKKHQKEGYELCDRVHCQAYHSMVRYSKEIEKAVKETENIVMKDEKSAYVNAFFHANCGGQTSDPKNVWGAQVPYLNSFKDTFCLYTKQATWEKRIQKQKWSDFLVKKYNYPITDTIYGPLLYTFNQPDRMAFYQAPSLKIPLKDIRQEFKLKSTFFNNFIDGNEVVIRGRGYGHGVGLCQEGAMRMARCGFNFLQIALYYFPGVVITNISNDTFYDQSGDLFLCYPYKLDE